MPALIAPAQRLARLCGAEPGALAFQCDGAALSFAEFGARVGECAELLSAHGVGSGSLVAVAVARSLALPVVLHAVVRCGAAYLPVDTRWPARRTASILAGSRATHVIFDANRPAPAAYGANAHPLADELSVARTGAAFETPYADLAYVIYTSGSSGSPKGVAVAHAPALRTIDWINAHCAIGARDCMLATASAAFDLSVYDVFGPCAAGASVLIASDEQVARAEPLVELLIANRATLWNSAPSVLDQVLEVAGDRVLSDAMRLVMLSGDWIPLGLPERIRRAFPRAKILAMGGATEAAIWSNYHWVDRVDPAWKSIPYGQAFDHAVYHVLDERLQPCGANREGDLYIGGACLAEGYLHAPELTAERFVRDPFAADPSARMYATRDRARRWPDGTIEFLGRRDEQVKVLGYRVDLVEIEKAAGAVPAVQQAVVVAANRNTPSSALAAYVIPAAEAAGPLRRLLALERRGEIAAHEAIELDDDTVAVGVNAGETRFLFRELFVEDCYGLRASTERCATVVDVGANIGLFALAIARRHPGARVIGVEPVPELARLARLNAEIHGVSLRVRQAALDETGGRTELSYYPNLSLLSRFGADAAADAALMEKFMRGEYGAEVETLSRGDLTDLIAHTVVENSVTTERITLSQLYAQEGLDEVDLLKVNVHGSERRIFAGLGDADLARTRRIVVETHDEAARDAIVARLQARGFRCAVTPHDCLIGSGVHMIAAVRGDAAGMPAATAAQPVARAVATRRALARRLEEALAADLPPHMIPRRWFFADTLPITPNGKVDRQALERAASEAANGAPDAERAPRASAETASSPVAQAIAEVWAEILGNASFGIDDNFFQLGGDSLKVTQAVTRLRRRLPLEVPLRAAFECLTVRELVAAIEKHNGV